MDNTLKPALFVGSSSEGLDLARAVRSLLTDDAEVTLWNEGLFTIGSTFIESLVNVVTHFDFAAIVLTPDDLMKSRQLTALGPRDNVIFELGLFMGRLGRSRTFVIRPGGEQVKIPSDLAGLTAAIYDWPRADGNHKAAVGPACDSIRHMIRTLKFCETKVIGQIKEVQVEQRRQRTDLETILRFLLENFLNQYERIHLKKLGSGKPFPFMKSETFEGELRRLLSLGLIKRLSDRGIGTLFATGNDVREHLEITDSGKSYLAYLIELERAKAD